MSLGRLHSQNLDQSLDKIAKVGQVVILSSSNQIVTWFPRDQRAILIQTDRSQNLVEVRGVKGVKVNLASKMIRRIWKRIDR